MIPFAGLAPDERTERGSGELTALDLSGALALGQQIRRAGARAQTTAELATVAVDALSSFDHEGRPACVLVRAFVTRPFASLSDELRAQIRGAGGAEVGAEASCLYLVASRGIDPAWSSVDRSKGHRALLLDGPASLMVTEVARQLRHGDPTGPSATSFHVPDPATNPAIPAKEFVTAYDVRSVFGIGASAGHGNTMVLIAFCRAPLDGKQVRLFDPVALYVRLAWMAVAEMRTALGDGYDRALAAALDELVARQESYVVDTVTEYRRRLDQSGLRSQRDAKAAEAAALSQTNHLHRTQRAMLNLIEDLREARVSLEATVAERTQELANANRLLEARNRELEEFVYIASHDLQEPLRTVGGYLQMIQRRYGKTLGVDADEFIQYAIEGAQRMQALIESLLLYSRVTSSDKAHEPIALDEPLDVALRNLALHIDETAAVITRPARLPTVRGDRIQMAQVFQNLLSNAIKFRGSKPPRVHITSERSEGDWTIAVRDEGIGFNPRFADRIFKIFRRLRRDTPGTGIGLAVCKKIVERHGGSIRADAKPGEGATFLIRLPAEAHEVPES